MENLKSIHIPLRYLVDQRRDHFGLSKIVLPFANRTETLYTESLKIAKTYNLQDAGPEAYMISLINEWESIKFAYDLNPSAGYPDRTIIMQRAQAKMENLLPYIISDWEQEINENNTRTPGLDALSRVTFYAERSAKQQRFAEIHPINMFEAILHHDSNGRSIAVSGGANYTDIARVVGRSD